MTLLFGHHRPARSPIVAMAALLALTAAACQGSPDRTQEDGREPSQLQWRSVPREELPAAFIDFTPRQVVSSRAEFLALGESEGGSSSVHASADGRAWYDAAPPEGQVRFLAAHLGTVTAAGTVQNGDTAVPAVWRSREKSRWSKHEFLPGGVQSDEVLGLARGDRGTVVVSHDGGPFGEDAADDGAFRGDSIRIWTASDGGAFGRPHSVACPQRSYTGPLVSVVADSHGYVVTADCNDRSDKDTRIVLTSGDGSKWRNDAGQFRREWGGAAAAGPRGAVLSTTPEGSAEHPGVVVTTLWSRTPRSEDWTPGEPLDVGRVPDIGAAPRNHQSINAVAPVPGGYLATGRSLDSHVGQPVGALWFSVDGRRWVKAPTKKNGFHTVFDLYGAAERNGTVILLGAGDAKSESEPDSGDSRMWLGRYGSAPSGEESGLAAFARIWEWGHGSLRIEASGRFEYRWRLFRSCGVQPAPCDSDSQWGGKATGQLTAEAPTGPLTGRIETTNRPADRAYRKGAPVVVKRMPYSAVHVTVDGKPHGLFCAAGAADSRCRAVHG
jgi:hypothetical protein